MTVRESERMQETAASRFVTQVSSPAEKIRLFRSLFRGREDVYPVRFESRRTGKAGYSPACANEWVPNVCEKPRVKCAECTFRRFLPVTDEVIRQHLLGGDNGEAKSPKEFVMGVYPMLLDESCFFLALDFDGEQWRDDAAAFLSRCRSVSMPVALERSRSGNGAHIWIFFEEAVPAVLARKLGSHLLTESMEQRPELGFDSYDRMFPNQDTLPRGGFGNLIALPLQKRARFHGNSLFLDEHFEPHPDQWEYLASIQKVSRDTLETTIHEAEMRGRVVGVRIAMADEDDPQPWAAPPSHRQREAPIHGPLPEMLELVVGDQIYIGKDDLVPPLRNRLLRLAAFQNPEFYRAQAMRLPTYDKPRIICCAEDCSQHLALPRGCLREVKSMLEGLKIRPILRDERFCGIPLDYSFRGELRPEQQIAANALMKHDTGVLAATTAFGKTVLAAWLIAQRKVNTLVLVHRQQLLEQWVERLSMFLGVPAKSIGRLGGGRKKLNGILDVALLQSMVRKDVVDDRIASYGYLIVDECHHLSARSFELVARRAKAKFVTGLSATVARKDGHHPIIFMQCGPVRHRVDAKSQAIVRPFAHHAVVRPTAFRAVGEPDADPRIAFQNLYQTLQNDEVRNRLICNDVIAAVREGRHPLLLTERKDHLERLAQKLSSEIENVITLRGGMGRKELRHALDRVANIPVTAQRVILATGKFVGEGFDDSRLDTLFLALPVSWQGTVAQYAGRLHRLHEGKREVRIYDYADLNVPMLARMFDKRCRGYEALGYTVLLPGSAIAGWPTEVPLPVEPEWKQDYAASIRRLVRDGVDVPLANLFVHAARKHTDDVEGVDRARSASEAFLFGRLETLPETAGRFRLNTLLPIPFDNMGTMEVDLYCADGRLAIELDGPHHFADAKAYRRDRRKDALLQRHHIMILRFLPEDLSQRLDEVLDAILAALASRERSVRVSREAAKQPAR